ncbi:polyprenyl synthetase family protein [Vibrio sp. AND4]|uniref:polyprenyl synthetase family protein n=1 Tax=Vibrio sp. AND4 TaxID=314289 RepID=UPI0002D802B7|nr:polyprenyl synthetase family protein [Vibrio sp. AND4]
MNNSSQSITIHHQEFIYRDCERYLTSVVSSNRPAIYHLDTGGSRVRMQVCLEISLSLGIHYDDAVRLAVTIELLHNASLIHDDIQDKDSVRRGAMAVWAKFGSSIAICTGDYLIAKAFGVLAEVSCSKSVPKLLEATQKAVTTTIEGQIADLTAKEDIHRDEYEDIAAKKAGPLLALSLELPLIVTEKHSDIQTARHAAFNLAVAYQILDDINDSAKDFKRGRPNLLNLNLNNSDKETALKLTKNRAIYLIKSCERDLIRLPVGCQQSLGGVVRKLRAMAKEGLSEGQ